MTLLWLGLLSVVALDIYLWAKYGDRPIEKPWG